MSLEVIFIEGREGNNMIEKFRIEDLQSVIGRINKSMLDNGVVFNYPHLK